MPCVVATFKIQFFKFASLWQIIENTMFYLILILFKFKNWTFDWPQTIHEYSLDGPLQCHHFPIFQKSQDDYRYIIYLKINKMIYLKLDLKLNANCAWMIRLGFETTNLFKNVDWNVPLHKCTCYVLNTKLWDVPRKQRTLWKEI